MQATPLARTIRFAENFAPIQKLDELKALVDRLYNGGRAIGFDIETGYSGSDAEGRAVNAYHPDQFIAGFSLTDDTTYARYVPVLHDFATNINPEDAWEVMKPLLEERTTVIQNAQFEAENLRQLDVKGHGPSIDVFASTVHDSMIQAYVLSDIPPMVVSGAIAEGALVRRFIPEFHRTADDYQKPDIKQFRVGLKSLSKFRYNYDQAEIHTLFARDKDLTAKEKRAIRFNTLPVDHKVVHYACDDAYLCLQLHYDQYEQIMEDPYLPMVYELEMQIAAILVDMRATGIAVDWDGIDEHRNMFQDFLHEMKIGTRNKFEEETGRDLTSLNLNSVKQIGDLIYGPKEEGGMGLTTARTTASGNLSTDDKALTHLRKVSPAIDSLLKYRQCAKMGKWFDIWAPLRDEAADERVHPSFIQVQIQSGRFASSNPNIQNLTKRWWFQNVEGSVAEVMRNGRQGKDYWTGNARDFIKASEGYTLLSFDYKSAEIQFLAALAQEDSIIQAFYSGEDFHKWTASLVFGKTIDEVTKKERQAAKATSFGIIYGQSVPAMAQQLDIATEEAQAIRDLYFSRFPNLAKYFEDQHRMVTEEYAVRTWMGRKATLWEAMSDNRAIRSKAERMSVNIPVQGGATGDYTKLAMFRCAQALKQKGWWGKEVRLLMNQHDSLVFEVSNELDLGMVTEFLTPLVQYSLAGWDGFYNKFETFPPMSVDWEAGYTWGSVADIDERDVLDKSELHVTLTEEAVRDDLVMVLDVIATNPGTAPVTLHWNGVEKSLGTVKVHPDVLHKLTGGDPDIGIMHKPGNHVVANFI